MAFKGAYFDVGTRSDGHAAWPQQAMLPFLRLALLHMRKTRDTLQYISSVSASPDLIMVL
jgi:hypothetical protein